MNQISQFLHSNILLDGDSKQYPGYKAGIVDAQMLEDIDAGLLGPLEIARLCYVKNLAKETQTPFFVPENLHPKERALMFASFGNFENALSALGIPLSCKIVGAEAVSRTGSHSTHQVLETTNTSINTCFQFSYNSYQFPDFPVQQLNENELLFIYIKIKELQAKEDNHILRESKQLAYLNRALFEENIISSELRTAFIVLKSEITNEVKDIEHILSGPAVGLKESTFLRPIVFRSELLIQLGRAFAATYDYGAAYRLLKNYPLYEERIDCLIGMRDFPLAVNEITDQINGCPVPESRSEQIRLSSLYIKLAHLKQDPNYFDVAASLFQSAKPYKLKGLMHFKQGAYELAMQALEEALRITPCDIEVKFSLGCVLMKMEQYGQALKIFRILKSEDPSNINASKNLAYCYYKLDDIRNMLDTLKAASIHDTTLLRQYLMISLKNDLIENVCWALKRVVYDNIAIEAANYVFQTGKISSDELLRIFSENVYFDQDCIRKLFQSLGLEMPVE